MTGDPFWRVWWVLPCLRPCAYANLWPLLVPLKRCGGCSGRCCEASRSSMQFFRIDDECVKMSRAGKMTMDRMLLVKTMVFMGLGWVFASCSVFSGESGRLRARRAEKLAKPVFSAALWHTDFDRARAVAASEGKIILAYFTNSYIHCGLCDDLESGLLSSSEFREFATSVVLFLHNTSIHYRGSSLPDEPYPRLAWDKGITGVPTLCFMDSVGSIIGKPFHSLAACEQMLQRAQRLVALRASGLHSGAEARELFFLKLELDLIPSEQVSAGVASWQLTEAEAVLVAGKIADAEVSATYAAYRASELSNEEFHARMYWMARNGRLPSTTTATMFWAGVLECSSQLLDPVMAEQAYRVLKVRFEGVDNGWLRWARPRWEEQLLAARAQPYGPSGIPVLRSASIGR